VTFVIKSSLRGADPVGATVPPGAVARLEATLSLFARRTSYDRKRILEEAERMRAKGRSRRAIALYRRVLAAEPRNIDLHYKIAPLLAKTGQRFDAWRSFQQAASACASNGQNDKALSIYREAARLLRHQFEAWMAVARLELRLGDKRRARESLLEGRRQMKGRGRRAEAIALLRAAREMEAWHPDTVLALAALLGKSRQGDEARWLLDELAERVQGRALARVRARQWRMEPSLRHSWYWIRDALRARRSRPDLPAAA
jgi:tetratricopeptide (TPR) repeat protein